MISRPFYRLLVAGGIIVTLLGLYAGSRTSSHFRWDSAASIVIIGVGVLLTIIGLMSVLGTGVPEPEEAPREAAALPPGMIKAVFGGFIFLVALVAGLVMGHFEGRNEGYITFMFAFIVANIAFGLGLALTRIPSYR